MRRRGVELETNPSYTTVQLTGNTCIYEEIIL